MKLIEFLRALGTHTSVTLILKNHTRVYGKMDMIDKDLNITLTAATVTPKKGKPITVSGFRVWGDSILYLINPDTGVPLLINHDAKDLEASLPQNAPQKKRERKPKGRGRGGVRGGRGRGGSRGGRGRGGGQGGR